MFHVRRRPADCAPRKRKKKPGALGSSGGGGQAGGRDSRSDSAPVLVELGPDGSPPHVADTARTVRLTGDVMEVGSANGIALQLYGPHIQPRHCVIANTDGLTSLTPCHADAHTYVNGQRIYQTTILQHGNLVKFGNSNTYQFLDPNQESRSRHPSTIDSTSVYDRSPRTLSPTDGQPRENYETTFDLDGNVETVSTASVKEDSRSLGSVSENRLTAIDRYPRGQDPILPAVLEFPEDPQEQFLARVITHLDVATPSFKLSPAYTLYLCARYRASTHYRPELTPTERAHKLTLLLQHAAMLIRHTVQERRLESNTQAFWLANASELLHFLKSDRHVSAFSLQAQDTLADAVQSAFRNLVNCLTDDLNTALTSLVSDTTDDHPNQVILVLSAAMSLLRKCRVNAALTIQLFSQLFHWISAKSLSAIINNPALCTKSFGIRLFNRLRNLQVWAESQGLELAAECHLAKILQCAHLLQTSKHTADELANLSAACFKLNSLQIRAVLSQYKGEMGEQVPSAALVEQTARAAESVADELTRADGREVRLHEDPTLPVQLLLPDDGFSCDVVQGVPQGLAEFLQPLQNAGLCRLAGQPTSSGHWTVYMTAPRSPSALSSTQPEVHVIRLHKAGGGMGLSIVAAKGAGQERLGIYIKSVVPGGAADIDGRLAAGDQLLTVDGQSLLGITQEKAAEFLVRTGNVVTLEVAKGGAVYHGLATLLQQPSPTPHRAEENFSSYYRYNETQDYFYGPTSYIYSPKQQGIGFFSSDDSLYKTELKKLTIPKISVEEEPNFRIEVTDFSDPYPTDTYIITDGNLEDFPKLNLLDIKDVKKNKQTGTNLPKLTLENNDLPYIDYDNKNFDEQEEKCDFSEKDNLNISQQDLSSSLSSINSLNAGTQELTLDLTLADCETPIKRKLWRSPNQVRLGYVQTIARHFETMSNEPNHSLTQSYPELPFTESEKSRKTQSTEDLNNKLTEEERTKILKQLEDWSTLGSDAKTDFESLKLNETPLLRDKFQSEQNLSDKETSLSPKNRSKSEPYLLKDDFDSHKCSFKNCIFKLKPDEELPIPDNVSEKVEKIDSPKKRPVLKGILKNFDEKSEAKVVKMEQKPFNCRLVRCDSLDSINKCQKIYTAHVYPVVQIKKFPESYIVTKRNKKYASESNLQFCNCLECRRQEMIKKRILSDQTIGKSKEDKSITEEKREDKEKTSYDNETFQLNAPKIIYFHKKVRPKTWKSCSDIIEKKRLVKKCCRYAKRNCPELKVSDTVIRDSKSCSSIVEDIFDARDFEDDISKKT